MEHVYILGANATVERQGREVTPHRQGRVLATPHVSR
jgi:hypothetical protein